MKKTDIFVLTTVFILLIVLVLFLIIGHTVVNTPPDINFTQNCFAENRSNIQLVVDYMLKQEYENVYVLDSHGKILADLEEKKIDDPVVCSAIHHLITSNIFVDINKFGNTIEFQLWQGTKDMGCGIAYSIDGVSAPDVQFMTECQPLSEEAWFYYIYDYNRWRNTH